MRTRRYPYSRKKLKLTITTGNINAKKLKVGSIDEKQLQIVLRKLEIE